jgi:alpha-beta hydrolase superfamily lysophospholipase
MQRHSGNDDTPDHAAAPFGVPAPPFAAQGAQGDVGVVLLHGKNGTPAGSIKELGAALQSAGFPVVTPTMPWGADRIYSASYEDALVEIDHEVQGLKQRGAKLVAVAGHSLGANAAIGYAAWTQADAIIALAPAHYPDLPGMKDRVAPDVSRARDLVAAGQGRLKQTFADLNQDTVLQVTATPEVYLTWLDPDGPAVMPRNAASFATPTPLLVVIGAAERTARWRRYFFDRAPAHPNSQFTAVPGGHREVPEMAIPVVAQWLRDLAPTAA